MRKVLKVLLILLAGFIGLLVVATIAIRVMFPPAKLRHLVESQIKEQLHREAHIGAVRPGLTGLSLSDFRLSDVPAFSAGTFLSVGRTDIRWALAPLMSRQLVVQHIVLDKPQIQITRMPDAKTLSISDLASASGGKSAAKPARTKAVSPAEAQGAKAWSWRVDVIQLRNGLIHFEDRSPAHQTSTLSNIDLTLRDFSETRNRGQLSIGQLANPVYNARDFSMEWTLTDLDPTLGHVNGSMRLKQGPGLVQNLQSLTNTSKSARLALLPLVTLQNLDRTGFIKLGLPDFSRLKINQINGDYGFKNGTMKINTFDIVGPELTIGATGAVELAPGNLSIDVAMKTPQPTLLGETSLKMHIGGTLSNPKTDLESLKKKAFKAGVKGLLDTPGTQKKISDTLNTLFH